MPPKQPDEKTALLMPRSPLTKGALDTLSITVEPESMPEKQGWANWASSLFTRTAKKPSDDNCSVVSAESLQTVIHDA
ncbi:MAG: hypothetical protein NTZ67_04190 [Gammaproteobacteria bacterium]|nr:hypothetical protein [Gammaproteobacteria bacterium]